ncbi:MAG TPA: OmpH family outer membrane protein [Bdellovibrionales bacterium]|nr:OmpH family outer membrane protein [Bdellovibrionales bacterium]
MTQNTISALIVSALISLPAFAADIKIGYIDMQKAIQETAAGKKAKKELEDEFNKKKKDLEKKEADIKKMHEDFEKRSMAMNEEARSKKQSEIRMEMGKYQESAGKAQMDIQKRERDLTKPIVDKLRKIIDDMAKKEEFTVILEKAENSVMWAKKEIDLTERVIKAYDSGK